MPVPVIIIGNLTIDDVIQADGSSQMGTLGGNSVHAAAAVRSVRARAPGAVITLDTHEDWRPGDDVLDTARLVDVFVPSRAELTELTGCDDPRQAADGLLAAGVTCVVVKLGGDGVLV